MPKPFTLDTVLQLRERMESIAQEKLAEARREEDRVQAELTARSAEYDALNDEILQLQTEGVEINILIAREEHLVYIKEAVKTLREKLEERRADVRRAHDHLVEKSRERQVMEKLKEKQNEAWKQYLNKKEAAVLDEMAIMFHDRK